jgi:ABC-2 type transport system ATP-binding protein
VLSSHLVADLEQVCDYLVILTNARVQLAGDVDDLLACHYRLTGPRRDPAGLPSDQQVIEASHTDRQSTFFIRSDGPIFDPAWTVEPVGLQDLVLAYMRRAEAIDRVREPRLGAVR